MQLRNVLALGGLTLFMTTGCDAGSFVVGTDLGVVPIDISVNLAQMTAVAGVSVEVTGPGIEEPIIANLPIAEGTATGQIRVLSGSDRSFLIRAFDAQSIETHRGGDTLDITADAVQSLSVALSPLVGDVELEATAGDYTVAVSLPGATISAGETIQATATVIDPAGDTLQSPQVVWGSSNPSVASVSDGGIIEGLIPGLTTIGASFQGFAGSATVTVQ